MISWTHDQLNTWLAKHMVSRSNSTWTKQVYWSTTTMSRNPVIFYGVAKVFPFPSRIINFLLSESHPHYSWKQLIVTNLRRQEGKGDILIPIHLFDFSRVCISDLPGWNNVSMWWGHYRLIIVPVWNVAFFIRCSIRIRIKGYANGSGPCALVYSQRASPFFLLHLHIIQAFYHTFYHSKVLWLRSSRKYHDSFYKILTNKSHVLRVPISNFWGPTQKNFFMGYHSVNEGYRLVISA